MTGTVNIKGVEYETVHSRLTAAHDTNARPKGIKSIATSPLEVAGRLVVCATITFDDGREFSGMSEAKLDATSGADRDAPVECAETSAVGRALANAGYHGSEGLASREEIRSAQNRGARFAPRPQPQNTTARPVPQDGKPRLAQGLEGPPGGPDDAPPLTAYDEAGPPPAPRAARPATGAPGLATDKQREMLRRFDFTEEAADPNLTKVRASDLISQAIEAQRGGRR